jgi:hypothetical protein
MNTFKVIHHVRKTFFGGIDSSRRKVAFARGKVQVAFFLEEPVDYYIIR